MGGRNPENKVLCSTTKSSVTARMLGGGKNKPSSAHEMPTGKGRVMTGRAEHKTIHQAGADNSW